METFTPAKLPKYVETATKTATSLLNNGYKTVSGGYKATVARVDLDSVPGAEAVRPYIKQATDQAEKVAEQTAKRLTIPGEWVDTYFDFAAKVIDNQRELTDRVMDNQRQFADRFLTAPDEATEPTSTAKKATKTSAEKATKKAPAKK